MVKMLAIMQALQIMFTINGSIASNSYNLTLFSDETISHTITTIMAIDEGDELGMAFLSVAGLTFAFGVSMPVTLTIVRIADLLD